MKYDFPIPTRAEWQKLREAAKVPKGAAKVSIGDSIEKVHKSFTPETISANVKDTELLITNIDAYINQTKAKYAAFEAVVKTKVRKPAANHLAFLKDYVKARTEYYPRYAATVKAHDAVLKGTGKPKDIASALEQLRGCVDTFGMVDPKWTARQQMVRQYQTLCATSAALTEQHNQALKAMIQNLKD